MIFNQFKEEKLRKENKIKSSKDMKSVIFKMIKLKYYRIRKIKAIVFIKTVIHFLIKAIRNQFFFCEFNKIENVLSNILKRLGNSL